jgi:hypothetical protein
MFTLPFGCMKSLFQKLFVIVFCLVRISPGRKIPVFGREHFLQSSWTLTFLFERLGGEGFLVFTPRSPCVPISFQTVPERFPEMFPMAPRFCGYGLTKIQLP